MIIIMKIKERKKTGEFKSRDVVDVQEAVFDYDAVVTTYACRAGISVNGKDLTGMDAGQENSPAQKMADCWDVSVRAFEMRSDYSSIYGTKKKYVQQKIMKMLLKNTRKA
ncbi:hypothetical protein LNQ52_14900 [Klebsiella pneumoniae subsp. pneumoniae]|nr:hypothetical protein [Klebsiella pneumoniae subsp. pneumoniae]